MPLTNLTDSVDFVSPIVRLHMWSLLLLKIGFNQSKRGRTAVCGTSWGVGQTGSGGRAGGGGYKASTVQ